MYNLVGDIVIKVDNYTYEIIENYKDGYEDLAFKEKYTDYFYDYDYIIGDWSYGKLRLKGFYNHDNKKCKKINNYDNLSVYLTENCAFDCAYFVAKKI